MNMCELIVKKKRGGRLNEKEIDWIVQGYTAGEIPDYQMSAMLMAICFTGMDEEETKNLTLSMAKSGDLMDLSAIHGKKIDKHSTGGVGDKTTLVIGPGLRQQREFLSQRCPAEDWDIREVRSTNWKVSMAFIPV